MASSSFLVLNSFSSVAWEAPSRGPWAPCLLLVLVKCYMDILGVIEEEQLRGYLALLACLVDFAGKRQPCYHPHSRAVK